MGGRPSAADHLDRLTKRLLGRGHLRLGSRHGIRMSLQDFLLSGQQEPVCPYLSDRTEPPPAVPGAEGGLKADIVVVGAGFTGLSAALALAEAGNDVLVLEARHVGWGGSGRAWGQVAAAAKFMPAKVERDFGPEAGRRINDAAVQGPDLVFGLVQQYGMRCDAIQTGNLIAAHTPAQERMVAGTARDLQRRGFPVDILDETRTRRMIGSDRYRLALFDHRGGHLNPLGYARGLARAAIGKGARIHEGMAVTALAREGGNWVLTTPRGPVTTKGVILATNAFTDDVLFPGVGRELMPVRAYQAVSEPLSAEALQMVLPGRQPLNDTRKLFSGVRLWPDGRLQIGVDGPPFGMAGKPFLETANRRIGMMYPFLRGLRWEYAWGGWVDMTADEYPRLHELAPGLWSGYGFSGRGIAIGTLLGRDLATLAAGGSRDALVHPVSPLAPLWFHRLHRPLISALVGWYRVLDRWNDFRFGKGIQGPLPEFPPPRRREDGLPGAA